MNTKKTSPEDAFVCFILSFLTVIIIIIKTNNASNFSDYLCRDINIINLHNGIFWLYLYLLFELLNYKYEFYPFGYAIIIIIIIFSFIFSFISFLKFFDSIINNECRILFWNIYYELDGNYYFGLITLETTIFVILSLLLTKK